MSGKFWPLLLHAIRIYWYCHRLILSSMKAHHAISYFVYEVLPFRTMSLL
jgi:hypothetical protein